MLCYTIVRSNNKYIWHFKTWFLSHWLESNLNISGTFSVDTYVKVIYNQSKRRWWWFVFIVIYFGLQYHEYVSFSCKWWIIFSNELFYQIILVHIWNEASDISSGHLLWPYELFQSCFSCNELYRRVPISPHLYIYWVIIIFVL